MRQQKGNYNYIAFVMILECLCSNHVFASESSLLLTIPAIVGASTTLSLTRKRL